LRVIIPVIRRAIDPRRCDWLARPGSFSWRPGRQAPSPTDRPSFPQRAALEPAAVESGTPGWVNGVDAPPMEKQCR